MSNKYPLPKLDHMTIEGYDLYKCPLEIDFTKKLNIIFGTNGLGKTTLLTMIQYAIIGPYCGAQKSRNYGGEQKKKRPIYEKNFFNSRMTEKNEHACVKIWFRINQDKYYVKHSLYKHSLEEVTVNGNTLEGKLSTYENYENKFFSKSNQDINKYLIYNYQKNLMASTGLPDENSLIVMMNEIMFFTEDREYIFWNEDTGKLLIAKYFMDAHGYLQYEKAQQQVKMYDSKARLKTYEMSFIKKFLGEMPENTKESSNRDFDLQKLQEVQSEITTIQNNIRKKNKQLNDLDKERIENRVKYENTIKEISELDNQWYINIFPDEYQEHYKRYVPSISMGKCPFCGSNGKIIQNPIDHCFFCGEKIHTKEKVDIKNIDIQKKNKEIERNILNKNFQLLKREIEELKKDINSEQKKLSALFDHENELKARLDESDDENYKKYQQMEMEKQELLLQLDKAKEQEIKMRKEIDKGVDNVFQDYFKTFKKYASSFFGAEQKVVLKLVGDKEDRIFQIELNGSERENYYDMSESQRIFLDLSYRLSILDYFHMNSYFLCETPDSTLDLMFEDNAVRTFSNYINSGNSLILSANARNSTLILKLIELYKDDVFIVNLLDKSNIMRQDINKWKNLEIAKFL